MAQRLQRLSAMRETWVRSLGREDSLEKEMATHSSILAWRIPWTEEPGGLQSTVHGVAKSRTRLSDFTHSLMCLGVDFFLFQFLELDLFLQSFFTISFSWKEYVSGTFHSVSQSLNITVTFFFSLSLSVEFSQNFLYLRISLCVNERN